MNDCLARSMEISGFRFVSKLFESRYLIVETVLISLIAVAVSLRSIAEGGLVRLNLVKAVAKTSAVKFNRGFAADDRSRIVSGRGLSSVCHGLSEALVVCVSRASSLTRRRKTPSSNALLHSASSLPSLSSSRQ